jgi:protein disulfide-isomerase A1
LKLINSVAKSVKGKLSWGWSDGVLYKDQIDAMGADSSKLPAIAAMDIHKRLNYPYKGENNEESLTKWSQGVADGSVEPFYKSQPVPTEQKEAVHVVVGKSFSDVVYDKTKDVFVEFYAPWCGHCKTLAPKYLQLAEDLKDNKNLIIAKVDATENDTPVQVEGFPTLYFFPSNNKDKPVPFNGARTVEAMKKFLAENAVASKVEKKDEL